MQGRNKASGSGAACACWQPPAKGKDAGAKDRARTMPDQLMLRAAACGASSTEVQPGRDIDRSCSWPLALQAKLYRGASLSLSRAWSTITHRPAHGVAQPLQGRCWSERTKGRGSCTEASSAAGPPSASMARSCTVRSAAFVLEPCSSCSTVSAARPVTSAGRVQQTRHATRSLAKGHTLLLSGLKSKPSSGPAADGG